MRVETVKVKWAIFYLGKWFVFSTLVLDPEFILCTSVGSFVPIVRESDVQKNMIWTGKKKLLVECLWGIYVLICYIVMLACNLLLVTSVILCNTTLCDSSLSGSGGLMCLVTLILGVVRTGRVQGVKQSSADWELLLSLLLMFEIFSYLSFM